MVRASLEYRGGKMARSVCVHVYHRLSFRFMEGWFIQVGIEKGETKRNNVISAAGERYLM